MLIRTLDFEGNVLGEEITDEEVEFDFESAFNDLAKHYAKKLIAIDKEGGIYKFRQNAIIGANTQSAVAN
jgi:hypothetical protein